LKFQITELEQQLKHQQNETTKIQSQIDQSKPKLLQKELNENQEIIKKVCKLR